MKASVGGGGGKAAGGSSSEGRPLALPKAEGSVGRTSQGRTFTDGELPRHVLRLSGFMILGFLAMTIAQLVEAVYLGMVGTRELAAVAFAFPVVMALGAATRGIGVGAGAVLARAAGAGDRARMSRLTSHALVLVLAFNLICAAALMSGSRPLFALLGAEGEILDLVTSYIAIWAVGFPAFGLSMVGTGLMRSLGDPAYPGVVMTTGSALQIVIGPFLIFGWLGLPAMGLEGAAWTFVAARGASFLLALYWFLIRERVLRLSATGFLDSARAILHVGVPAMATNLIGPVSTAIVTRLLAGLGVAVVAGFGIASRIEAVVSMVVIGIASSAGPLVGQNWGARLYDRVWAALKLCYRYCLVWSVIAACIMWLGGAFFVSLVNDEEAVVATATAFLYIVPISIGFMGMLNVANGAFNALSKPWPPLLLSILRLTVFYVPLALVARHFFGYVGVFAAIAVSDIALGLWARGWNRRTLRREQGADR